MRFLLKPITIINNYVGYASECNRCNNQCAVRCPLQ